MQWEAHERQELQTKAEGVISQLKQETRSESRRQVRPCERKSFSHVSEPGTMVFCLRFRHMRQKPLWCWCTPSDVMHHGRWDWSRRVEWTLRYTDMQWSTCIYWNIHCRSGHGAQKSTSATGLLSVFLSFFLSFFFAFFFFCLSFFIYFTVGTGRARRG